ncbi:NAD(P)/FAD-dependent oxidoreductase [Metallosphaera tengchongensis]|uniref:Pyridine nucleotide-disulfide oxidoreductase domain-containing protein 2 n=1 Tax=Metallosphaera tengchongensis TaxID=1532350 RepID=A0A6N0NQU7_9CREN|nr:NAD(P)/FAD-dependent oxidoreductase [Metallosphaera tengchongensis]QKQ99095.1 NAD(P)/FAD-dependent oxidoreductase [Metallosphaera tengchongensis]
MRVIVIGSGHNGLIASYYLRKLGLEVRVVEASDRIGGMTESVKVGNAVISRASYVLGVMPEELISEFSIPILTSDIFQTIEYDGKLVPFHRDDEKRRKNLKRVFDSYDEFERKITKMKDVMRKFTFLSRPPTEDEVIEVAEKEGIPEILRETSREFLSDYLPAEVHRYFVYPSMEDSPAYMVAYFFNKWSLVPGGMGTVSEAIAEKARAIGVDILTNMKVERVIERNGRVVGVKVGDKEIKADIVVSAVSPVSTLAMVDSLSHLRLDPGHGGWVKYNVVFKETPKIEERLRPYLEGIVDLEIGEIVMPSYLDSRRGGHVLEFMGDREEVLSAFRGEILYEERIDPSFASAHYNLPGGNLNHLPMRPPFLFDGRPVKGWGYRTPVRGLYLTGAGTYPGGQVTGIPGRNVALAVQEDIGQGF